jgi:hypothetical protein
MPRELYENRAVRKRHLSPAICRNGLRVAKDGSQLIQAASLLSRRNETPVSITARERYAVDRRSQVIGLHYDMRIYYGQHESGAFE